MDTPMQHTAMHCNALQHTVMDTLADTVAAVHYNTHQHRVTQCNTLPTVEFSLIWPTDLIILVATIYLKMVYICVNLKMCICIHKYIYICIYISCMYMNI